MAPTSSAVFDWRQTTRRNLAMSIFYFQRVFRYAFAGRPQKPRCLFTGKIQPHRSLVRLNERTRLSMKLGSSYPRTSCAGIPFSQLREPYQQRKRFTLLRQSYAVKSTINYEFKSYSLLSQQRLLCPETS